ncbi:hypothetical protein HAX54_004991 [Datura stramonium]|uniref:Uncharacterized protein n=1 Tax=Datura stramonium TaxID=4076 RepID=A0ABS8T8Q6_DATST|nr:hypothetical protein [Datura stramonium]
MTRRPINIRYWMLKEIHMVRDVRSKSRLFGNTHTTLVMWRSIDIFDPKGYRVIAAPTLTVDITIIQGQNETPIAKLAQVEERDVQANMRVSRVCWGEGSELPENENINAQDLMRSASKGGEDKESNAAKDDDEEEEENASFDGGGDVEGPHEE